MLLVLDISFAGHKGCYHMDYLSARAKSALGEFIGRVDTGHLDGGDWSWRCWRRWERGKYLGSPGAFHYQKESTGRSVPSLLGDTLYSRVVKKIHF